MTPCICGHGLTLHGSDQSPGSRDAGCRWPDCGCSYYETPEQAEKANYYGTGMTGAEQAALRAMGIYG